ncbi:hypothetical protein ANCDUO_16657, partial [Ancylostoma duodenale]
TLMRGVEASLNPEFQIQNEDFPALPGASPGDHPAQAPASLSLGQAGEVSNIPPTMLADQFGMAGLVTYLRTVDNPSIVSLALGYDLTTLGLNLNLS